MMRGTWVVGVGRHDGERDKILVVGVPDVARRIVQYLGQPMVALQAPCHLPVFVDNVRLCHGLELV